MAIVIKASGCLSVRTHSRAFCNRNKTKKTINEQRTEKMSCTISLCFPMIRFLSKFLVSLLPGPFESFSPLLGNHCHQLPFLNLIRQGNWTCSSTVMWLGKWDRLVTDLQGNTHTHTKGAIQGMLPMWHHAFIITIITNAPHRVTLHDP